MRKSLITILTVTTLSATGVSAATVINGDFEVSFEGVGQTNGNNFDDLATGSGNGNWDVWSEIPGWTTIEGPGVEIQTNNTGGNGIKVDAQSGNHYIELASHGVGNSNSTIAQEIEFSAGTYLLSFYYSPRTNKLGQNGIAFGVGDLASSVSGPTPDLKRGEWTLVQERFTVGDETSSLFFSAFGARDTLGGLVDNISISEVPLPASSLLLLAGLGGLGAMRRRNKS